MKENQNIGNYNGRKSRSGKKKKMCMFKFTATFLKGYKN